MVKDSNVRVMITLTKEVDDKLSQLVELSKSTPKPITKSQVVEVALRQFINQLLAKEK